MKETGTPVVRALINSNVTRQLDEQRRTTKYRTPRPSSHGDFDRQRSSDKKCPLCQRLGHSKSQCNDFAKFLIFREMEPSINAANKLVLVNRFRTDMKKKNEIRRKRASLGTIRELWNSGRTFEEAEHSLLAQLPDLNHPDEESSDGEYSDE
jgi:hypothetical protein